MTSRLHRVVTTTAALLLLAGVAACDQAEGLSEPGPSPASTAGPDPALRAQAGGASRVSAYVALGDSFTAAPYVPVTDLADGCFRSSGNYPALLADRLRARLTDVSCGGADTDDVRRPQPVALGQGRVPPQIRAVHPDTDLVTVGLGGNDENLFAHLVSTCTELANRPGTPCADRLVTVFGRAPADVVSDTGRKVEEALRLVHRRAPDARVVLVGYPRLVDRRHGCSRFPLSEGDRPLLARLETRLDEALEQAARASGADYVDMHRLSRGHAICDPDPWVNGRRTDQDRALAFHPFAVEQQAVADAVTELVEGG